MADVTDTKTATDTKTDGRTRNQTVRYVDPAVRGRTPDQMMADVIAPYLDAHPGGDIS